MTWYDYQQEASSHMAFAAHDIDGKHCRGRGLVEAPPRQPQTGWEV